MKIDSKTLERVVKLYFDNYSVEDAIDKVKAEILEEGGQDK
ncbi:hypothetical protein CLSAB_18820 [Clostridium saccharobutylicum]|nr:hypothetical protein [Clostridium saccharobutylicum]OOM17162.1 hypothetical protein CLSAB_18820 [Clostridium saccharobutylicum]